MFQARLDGKRDALTESPEKMHANLLEQKIFLFPNDSPLNVFEVAEGRGMALVIRQK